MRKQSKWTKGIAMAAIAAMSVAMLAGCGSNAEQNGSKQDVSDGQTYKSVWCS